MATRELVISIFTNDENHANLANIPILVPAPDPVLVTDLHQVPTRDLLEEVQRRLDSLGAETYGRCGE